MGEDRPHDVYRELELATEAMNDARVLSCGDGSVSGVLNRLYYAAFHGAQAALYDRGYSPSSHGQVRQQFGQHVVLEGDVPREVGRLLGTLYDYRREADYRGSAPDVDLTALRTEVREFVELSRELVNDPGE